MERPWTAEHTVDEALARSLVETQFPDLAPARLTPLGVGWDNTVYDVDGRWVFRFPRRAIAVPLLETELSPLSVAMRTDGIGPFPHLTMESRRVFQAPLTLTF